ncbi:hypothetical protein H4Q26_005731, partial [Puccinia striiformis f. sp. tritici PST-130]
CDPKRAMRCIIFASAEAIQSLSGPDPPRPRSDPGQPACCGAGQMGNLMAVNPAQTRPALKRGGEKPTRVSPNPPHPPPYPYDKKTPSLFGISPAKHLEKLDVMNLSKPQKS